MSSTSRVRFQLKKTASINPSSFSLHMASSETPLCKDIPICQNCQKLQKKLDIEASTSHKTIESLKYLLQFKDLALESRESMLKDFIEENKTFKENLKNYQKALIPTTNESFIISPKINQIKAFTFSTTEPNNSVTMKSNILDHIKQNLFRGTSIKEQIRRNKGNMNINKGLFTTSRNFVKKCTSNVVTVTETQGLLEDKSIFTNKEGRLNLLQTDEDRHFENNKNFKKLQELVFSEDFLNEFLQYTKEEKSEFQDLIRSFLKDFHRILKINQNLKRIIKTSLFLSSSLDLDESLKNIHNEASSILNCQKVKVFILDEYKKEFWNKVGTEERIEWNNGILGHVRKMEKMLKIDEWKKCQFFDGKTNIKTMICAPILDNKGKIIAILQTINKQQGPFTPDDVNLITVLCTLIGICLKNAMIYDNLTLKQKKFKKCVGIGIEMLKSQDLPSFIKSCQFSLQEIMSSQSSQLIAIDRKTQTLIKLDPEDNNKVISIPKAIGLIQLCIDKRQVLEVVEPLKHEVYNPQLDLQSNLSILTVPIIELDSQEIVGVFQVNNVMNNLGKSYGNSEWIDKEVLDFICNIIRISINRLVF